MKNLTILLVLLGLALTACSGEPKPELQSTPALQPTTGEPTQAVSPTTLPTAVADPAGAGQAQPTAQPYPPAAGQAQPTARPYPPAAQASPVAPAQPGGATTYKIVPGESKASYEVGETFFNQNNRFNLAIGTTGDVSGEILVDPSNPQNSQLGEITVDISKLQSDSSRRDGRIREQWLESARYPIATFKPTAVEGLPAAYSTGDQFNFKVAGDLTVRETTRPVTFDVTAALQNGALVGTAKASILMSEFGFGPIEIAGMLGTEDLVKLTLAFVARP